MRPRTDKERAVKDPLVSMDQIITGLETLRRFKGHPGRFWPAFMEIASCTASARLGMLLVRDRRKGIWKKRSVWPVKESQYQSPEMFSMLSSVAGHTAKERTGSYSQRTALDDETKILVLGIRLNLDEDDRDHIAVFILDDISGQDEEKIISLLKLISDTPVIYQRGRTIEQTSNDAARFAGALDLMILLNAEKKYIAAAMTVVNEVSSRYRCSRVSLGWIESGYVRLQSISHMERFEKKMDIIQTLEAAMEEAFDQDEEILWPSNGQSTAVVRDHEIYSRGQGIQYMVSIPVRLDNEPLGVLTCERNDTPFSEEDVLDLRLLCDQAAARLGDLKEKDRWFGARMVRTVRNGLSGLFGVEHTLAKCTGLLISGLLLFALFGTSTYRIEAPFILKSDDVRYLPTPFEGYIDEVNVRPGERVEQGQLLLNIDTTELLLQESAAIANHVRYSREAEKARSENALAEMKISVALAEQAKAKLDLVRYHLSRADVRAPFSGIVVEGDLAELQGVAINKGDVLFKISRLEEMYAELEVSESDIHEIAEGKTGEIAFVSQPQIKYPFRIEKINPVAIADSDMGNVFLVRCLFPEGMSDWWRPGMSGVAKINIGKRNILWLLTHRTVDFFRIHLWW